MEPRREHAGGICVSMEAASSGGSLLRQAAEVLLETLGFPYKIGAERPQPESGTWFPRAIRYVDPRTWRRAASEPSVGGEVIVPCQQLWRLSPFDRISSEETPVWGAFIRADDFPEVLQWAAWDDLERTPPDAWAEPFPVFGCYAPVRSFGEVQIRFLEPVLRGQPAAVLDRDSRAGGIPRLILGWDMFYLVALHISRGEEEGQAQGDRYGRFQSSDSMLRRHDLLLRPPVNQAAICLLQCFRVLGRASGVTLPRVSPWPRFAPALGHLTHDVDRLEGREPINQLKRIVSIPRLLAKCEFTESIRRASRIGQDLRRGEVCAATLRRILDIEGRMDAASTFFLLGGPRYTRHGARFDLHSRQGQQFIRSLRQHGKEIGLHGSYGSSEDASRLRREKELLERLSGLPVISNRFHYLNLRMPSCVDVLDKAGLCVDSSLGYSDCIGFRTAFSYPHPLPDPLGKRRRCLEIPLSLMDGAILGWEKPATQGGQRSAAALVGSVLRWGGVATLLWHFLSFDDHVFPGHGELYEWVLKRLKRQGVPLWNSAQIYHWWRGRAALRVRRVSRTAAGLIEWEWQAGAALSDLGFRLDPSDGQDVLRLEAREDSTVAAHSSYGGDRSRILVPHLEAGRAICLRTQGATS